MSNPISNKHSPERFIEKYGVAITASIACGKSTIAKILAELGYTVFDADKISREVVSPGSSTLTQVKNIFGSSVVNENGELNRPRLKEVIFSDPSAKSKVESILHPAIASELIRKVKSMKEISKPFFYEAALILETNQQDRFAGTLVVECSPETQKDRLIKRDNLSEEEALKVISTQMPNSEKVKRADWVINSESNIPALKTALNALVENIVSDFDKA